MNQISSADNSIAVLVQQAEAERQAEEAAAAQQAAEEESQESSEEDYGYDPEEDTTDSSSSSTSSDVVVEEVEEESYEEPSQETYTEEEAPVEDTGSSSGQGTYLGNFTLTAYCNCAQCCGTAGNLTASGTVPTSGHTVAMAGDVYKRQVSG